MTQQVQIAVPDDLDDQGIKDYLAEHWEKFADAFDQGSKRRDSRANFEGLEINEVELEDDQVVIEYEVYYSAHFGCSDMDYYDADPRTLIGHRNGLIFSFDVHITPPERIPSDDI